MVMLSRRILHSSVSVWRSIKQDQADFSDALLSADIALAPLVEDWVENYQQTANDDVSEKASVHELILFVVRACGLATDVEEDEAMDVDGVLDVVERIQDESVRVSFSYVSPVSTHITHKIGYGCCLPPDLASKEPQTFQDESRPFHFPLDQDNGNLRHLVRRGRNYFPHHPAHFYPPHLAQYNVILPSPTDSTYINVHGAQSGHRALLASGRSW